MALLLVVLVCLHTIENLTTFCLVLLFGDEAPLAHRLQLAETVGFGAGGSGPRWRDVTSIAFETQVRASIGLVLSVSDVCDRDRGSRGVQPRKDQPEELCPFFADGDQGASTRNVVPVSLHVFAAGISANGRNHENAMRPVVEAPALVGAVAASGAVDHIVDALLRKQGGIRLQRGGESCFLGNPVDDLCPTRVRTNEGRGARRTAGRGQGDEGSGGDRAAKSEKIAPLTVYFHGARF